ncbi:MAG: DUF5050 domain-containing protein [Chloroflexota bacterium]
MKRRLFILTLLFCLLAACNGAPVTPAETLPLPSLPLATDVPMLAPTPSRTPRPPKPTPTATTPAEPLDGRGGGLVAFYSERSGNAEIFIMNADGSAQTRLTDDPAEDVSPALSPDGRQIVFITARHDLTGRFPHLKYELYLINTDGSGLRRLTTSQVSNEHPAWSPDGKRISFDSDSDGDGFREINLINPDGSGQVRLTSNQANAVANDQFADWSPDGSQIIFSSDRNGNWDLYVMNADGSDQRQLTSSPDWEVFPAWSPDDEWIVYSVRPANSRNVDVYVMRPDGSDQRRLTDIPGYDEDAVWSPDGRYILFQTDRDGNFELYVMNADGSDQHSLTKQRGDDYWPSWSIAPGAP